MQIELQTIAFETKIIVERNRVAVPCHCGSGCMNPCKRTCNSSSAISGDDASDFTFFNMRIRCAGGGLRGGFG